MFTYLFDFFMEADAFFWGYIGFSLIMLLGCYLTIKTRVFQIRAFRHVIYTFLQEAFQRSASERGLHPLKAFFASVGGMLGVGNVVGIVTAIQLGGPGALLWVWVAGFAGTLIKYAEIYLGLKHRVKNERQSYDGGPMFFLKKAFKAPWISGLVCVLLCIYGAEIYQFNVVVDTLAYSWGINRLIIAFALLALIVHASLGGVSRVAQVCSWIMPLFMVIYISLCLWVIGHHVADLPAILLTVVKSAFTGHAAIGGFAGSSLMLAIQNGIAGASYAADIGIGYDSTIQSESHTVYPERQARMAFLGVCLDNFICTLSILVVLVTGLWQTPIGGENAPLVQLALARYFPLVNMLMPLFIFILGYTTLIAYLIVGMKCARYLHPTRGASFYMGYAIAILTFFAFFDQTHALLVMRLAGALLLIVNLTGIYRLRHEIVFTVEDKIEEKAIITGPASLLVAEGER
ncbi:amino acid carrier protein [Candidatus Protochlamydia phocaeensis]|uniref:amino acid carrier protein n=1 Tax=Candidatus Protochlamydia phocaeensis TaxID=1414722 RepID=UPI000838D53A|nr:amino acid carrier protein [Candidatus Protochlamydia phocaeensis]